MKKLTETCYMNVDYKLTVLKPTDSEKWIVLNEKSALLFGPDTRAKCFNFAENYSEE